MNLAPVRTSCATSSSPSLSRGLLLSVAAIAMVGVTFGFPEAPAAGAQELADVTKRLDQAIAALRSGQQPSAGEQARNQDAFMRFERILFEKHNVGDNAKLPEPDRTDYYLNAIKMSLLDPQRHGGWAFRSTVSQAVRLELLHRLDRQYDPFLAFCALFPALKRNETEYAVGAYEALVSSDAFLADKVIAWSAEYKKGQLDWLGVHYLKMGQTNKVHRIVADARRIGTELALMSAGALLERMGDYAEAEAVLRQMWNEQRRNNVLSMLYSRHPREVDANGISFQQHRDALQKRLFPSGMQKVVFSEFTTPPRFGMTFSDKRDTLQSIGMKTGDVIVAVDGYHIENELQYTFVRNLNPDNDRMALIVWNGKSYVEIDAWVQGRKFGLPMKDYSP